MADQDFDSALAVALNADWLKTIFLYGINLIGPDKQPYPDIIFEQNIAAAISVVEDELDLYLRPQRVKGERHDYVYDHSLNYHRTSLDRGPLWRVEDFSLRFGSLNPIKLPLDWVQMRQWHESQVEIIAVGGQVSIPSSIGVFYNGTFSLASGYNTSNFFPSFLSYDYLAGFPSWCSSFEVTSAQLDVGDVVEEITFDIPFPDGVARYDVYAYLRDENGDLSGVASIKATNKTCEGLTLTVSAPTKPVPAGTYTVTWSALTVPSGIIQAVGLQAALQPLDLAGDLILGAGIASRSIGIDGFTENVNTTSSATNSGYGARVRQYEREYKARIAALKSQWQRSSIFAF